MIAGIIATGFIVGLLVGLTGMGGGLLMSPLLILLYGFSPTMAIGTDLVYAATTKAAGTLQHLKQKTYDWSIVKQLAKGSILGGIIGVLLIRLLKYTYFPVEEILGKAMGITFIAVAILMSFRLARKSKNSLWQLPLPLVGFLGGFLVGFTSVGSGSLFMMFLLASTSLSAPLLVGTDVIHAFLLTLVTGAFQAAFGNVDWHFVCWLIVGSIPGILIGGRLTLHIPEWILRFSLILVLLCTGIKMV